jgi:hypothetical protein
MEKFMLMFGDLSETQAECMRALAITPITEEGARIGGINAQTLQSLQRMGFVRFDGRYWHRTIKPKPKIPKSG